MPTWCVVCGKDLENAGEGGHFSYSLDGTNYVQDMCWRCGELVERILGRAPWHIDDLLRLHYGIGTRCIFHIPYIRRDSIPPWERNNAVQNNSSVQNNTESQQDKKQPKKRKAHIKKRSILKKII